MQRGNSKKPDVLLNAAGDQTWERLMHSAVVRQFQMAFTSVTGLLVTLLPSPSGKRPAANFMDAGYCVSGCDDPQGRHWCQRTLEAAQRKAVSEGRYVQFKCPSGLTKVIVPVAIGKIRLGLMLVGPFIPENLPRKSLGELRERLKTFGLAAEAAHLKAIWAHSPTLTQQKASAATEMVHLFALYLSESANRICLEDAAQNSRLLKRIEACLGEFDDAGVESRDVARRLRLSPCYFCKLFRKETGMTFSEYRSRRRVEKARQLLLNPSARIGEIADACGFRSLPCFIRAFHRHQGCPPSLYRMQHRLLIADNKTPIQA